MTGALPPTASVVATDTGGKLHAPSAARNMQVIVDLVASVAPQTGTALEIASGTGQHIVALAQALPRLQWQPSDVAPDRIASINARAVEATGVDIAQARHLDATDPGWAAAIAPVDLVMVVNLLHLVSQDAATCVLGGMCDALSSGGVVICYGPFRRSGELISEGDAQFNQDLRRADPDIGYKDDEWVLETLAAKGLRVETRAMPANNLAFIGRKGK
ncbi:class I SAM-dependent methyltransferase [Sulfitobacter sp. S190]|uniref:class I SAM-dependent methyltransferase n=1 Tax=Sulfitobacter sp. S190 TaxID=2867022 RepID=UPI0021A5BEC4|nr:class I SAM-dependent methyltransferase [Sulfitobacter sp. S190]UWR21792.1 DUF938 domain-containing protein [Sulfitobacter sp. S190]